MTPTELKAIRLSLGMTQAEFADALGFTGERQTRCVAVSRLERGYRPITIEHIVKVIALKSRAEEATTTSTPPMRAPDDTTADAATTQEDTTK